MARAGAPDHHGGRPCLHEGGRAGKGPRVRAMEPGVLSVAPSPSTASLSRGNSRGAARDRDPACLLPARRGDDRQGRSARYSHPSRLGVHSHRGPNDYRARRELPARADPGRPARQAADPGRTSLLHWPEQLAAGGRGHPRRHQHPASLRRQLLRPLSAADPSGAHRNFSTLSGPRGPPDT